MSEGDVELSNRSSLLRDELKAWEKKFALANDGRKAGRGDIKADADIAAKYKEYNRLRDVLSGKVVQASTITLSPGRKRKRSDVSQRTPSKVRSENIATPRRQSQHGESSSIDEAASMTPMPKLLLVGPTPQRDGKLLGLFDDLPADTPSKPRTALKEMDCNVVQTPGKRGEAKLAETEVEEETLRHSRTPMSSSKRFLLDQFATPQKLTKHEPLTPLSSTKGMRTPAFLRRHTMPTLGSDFNARSPQRPQPWKRRSFGRSLSSVLEEVRKREEEERQRQEHAYDDDMEALREMEASIESQRHRPARLDVKDTRGRGNDEEEEMQPPSDLEGSQARPQEVQQQKPWKKKGLKRQTKRVLMRPVMKKAPTNLPSNIAESDDGSSSEDGDHVVNTERPEKPSKEKNKSIREEAAAPKRKIRAEAHANYRALKIKNKNSKAKGRGGRFGRR